MCPSNPKVVSGFCVGVIVGADSKVSVLAVIMVSDVEWSYRVIMSSLEVTTK